jgi:hypothetical protein
MVQTDVAETNIICNSIFSPELQATVESSLELALHRSV